MNEKVPQSDVIFKNLFSAKRNEDLLVDFLESILQIKIDKIEAQKEVEPEIHNIEEKQGRLDIKAIVNDELIVDIEMQNIDYKDTEKRAVFYERKDLMEMAMNQNEKIRRANEEYEYLTGDEAVKRREELRDKALRDEAAARRCGREEGEEARNCNRKSFGRTGRRKKTERLNGEKSGEIKAKMETAKNMLKDDKMDKKIVIKYTGLTLKEIEKIMI